MFFVVPRLKEKRAHKECMTQIQVAMACPDSVITGIRGFCVFFNRVGFLLRFLSSRKTFLLRKVAIAIFPEKICQLKIGEHGFETFGEMLLCFNGRKAWHMAYCI